MGNTGLWGKWMLLGDILIGPDDYPIDLMTCVRSSEVLDWLCQINGRAWASSEVIGDLLRAFDEILQPQANLCSGGRDKVISKKRISELIQEYRYRSCLANP